jgi:hypothetical protein
MKTINVVTHYPENASSIQSIRDLTAGMYLKAVADIIYHAQITAEDRKLLIDYVIHANSYLS